MDVLVKISDTERDLIRVVVDVVTELREGEGEEDAEVPESQASTYSSTPRRRRSGMPRFDVASDPEARIKAALVDLRCLQICIAMLERVNSVSSGVHFFGSREEPIILTIADAAEQLSHAGFAIGPHRTGSQEQGRAGTSTSGSHVSRALQHDRRGMSLP